VQDHSLDLFPKLLSVISLYVIVRFCFEILEMFEIHCGFIYNFYKLASSWLGLGRCPDFAQKPGQCPPMCPPRCPGCPCAQVFKVEWSTASTLIFVLMRQIACRRRFSLNIGIPYTKFFFTLYLLLKCCSRCFSRWKNRNFLMGRCPGLAWKPRQYPPRYPPRCPPRCLPRLCRLPRSTQPYARIYSAKHA